MALDLDLKICFVSPTIYPLFNAQVGTTYNDAEVQLYELAVHFGKNQNWEVSVVTADYGQEEVEYYSGVLVYKTDFQAPTSFYQTFFPKASSLHRILKKVDAQIYIMAGASGLTKDVAQFCKKHRRSFLYRVTHQRDCDGTFIKSDDSEGKAFVWALKQAYRVICQTGEQTALLKRHQGIHTVLIPNAARLYPSGDSVRNEVVWVGEALNWKQPEFFFRLALTIPEYQFTFVSRPNDPAYFERLIEKTRVIPNLGVQNSIPYHELPTILGRAKVLVNTSRFEGFPYMFSLALASGVPLASLHVDPDRVIEQYGLGVFANGSEFQLVQGVRDLITYHRQWKRMSDTAYQFIKEKQNINHISQDYIKLFIGCLGHQKR